MILDRRRQHRGALGNLVVGAAAQMDREVAAAIL
jgi:hypothetical protein